MRIPHKAPTLPSPLLAIALTVAIQASTALPLLAQPLADVCLVYTYRTSSKSSGYAKGSYSSAGIAVVGPQYTGVVEGFDGEGGPDSVEVNQRDFQDYFFFNDSFDKKKKYYSPGMSGARVAGLINLAKAGSSKASIAQVFTYADFATTSLSDSDAIGKASWRAPYPGVTPGWLATSLSTSYKTYDVNPDRNWEDPTAPYNYVGQTSSEYLPCATYSGKTTYAHDAKRSESVKGMTFAQACAAVEQWLEASGYERADMEVEPEN